MPSRRALVQGLTALLPATALATTGAYAEPVSDVGRRLAKAYARRGELVRARDEAWETEVHARIAYLRARPPVPDALKPNGPREWSMQLTRARDAEGQPLEAFFDTKALQAILADTAAHMPGHGCYLTMEDYRKDKASIRRKARERLLVAETWEAECAAVREACGLNAAKKRHTELRQTAAEADLELRDALTTAIVAITAGAITEVDARLLARAFQ
jgi:hypothetical protein